MLGWLNCRHLTLRRKAALPAGNGTQIPQSCSPCVDWAVGNTKCLQPKRCEQHSHWARHATNHTSCAMEGSWLGAVLYASVTCLHLPRCSFGCAWKGLTERKGNCECQKTRLCLHFNLLTNTNINRALCQNRGVYEFISLLLLLSSVETTV